MSHCIMHLPGDIMSQLMHPPRRHFVPLSQFESPHLGQSLHVSRAYLGYILGNFWPYLWHIYEKTIVQLAFFGRQIVPSDKMSHFLPGDKMSQPVSWQKNTPLNMPKSGLFHLRQNIPTTFHNFHVHKCISWDILSPGRKWDILSPWDNLSPEKCQWNNGFSVGSSVGHFVAGEEMGHFVAGTICRMGRKWDILSSGTICRPKNAGGTICRWDKMSPNRLVFSN